MPKGFYVDLKRGDKFALLAGPFVSEPVARRYEKAAVHLAHEADPRSVFDLYGVLSLEQEKLPRGRFNDQLGIAAGDLLLAAVDDDRPNVVKAA